MYRKSNMFKCSDKKNILHVIPTLLLICHVTFLILVAVWLVTPVVDSETPTYIPSAPVGTTFGYIGIDYEYVIVTLNPDSLWMFDWGDGTNSSWLRLEQNQTIIKETHHWDAIGTYQIHVKYKSDTASYGVWSDALMVEIGAYSTDDYPEIPILYTGKIQGFNDTLYTYSALTTDPYEYPVCYRFDFGNGTFSEWTSYVSSGVSSYLSFIWSSPGTYHLRIQAKNQYGLESLWSEPIQVIILDKATANGASIDLVVLHNISYQIIYSSEDEGTFYNPESGISNDILWKSEGAFLIDDDGDGRWEYLYIPSIGQIQPYAEPISAQDGIFSQIPWLLIIIVLIVIFGVVGIVLVLLRTGYLYFYEEEVEVKK